jgi:hypothetical protein
MDVVFRITCELFPPKKWLDGQNSPKNLQHLIILN